jgi:hypothetical protein
MSFIGTSLQHHRADVIYQNAPRLVLFLYSGIIRFDFGSGDEHIRTDTLEFPVTDTAFRPEQIFKLSDIAVTVVPTNFNATNVLFVLAVTNPRVFIPSPGAGLFLAADVSIAHGSLFEVAYQFPVNAKG